MATKAFPADFTENLAPLLTQYTMVSDGTSAKKVLVSTLAELLATSPELASEDAVSSGALANPTNLLVNGSLPTDAQVVVISSGVFASLPAQTEEGAILIYAIGPCALVPYLYPAGSQTINGALDTIYPLSAAGLYVLTRDGGVAWGVLACSDVYNDLAGTSAAPTVNDDTTQGYAAKSIRIDSAGAIWMCTNATAAAAVWAQISNGQALGTVSTATGTLGVHSVTQVTYGAGTCALTAPVSQTTWPIGVTRRIRKSHSATTGITLAPNAGGSVNGAAADVVFTLPGSDIISSTTTSDMFWDVTRDAASVWRVSAARMTNASSTVAGLMSAADKTLIDAITSTSVTSPRFLASGNGTAALPNALIEPSGNSGLYWDATKGIVASVDGADRIKIAVAGYTEITSAFGANTAILFLQNTAANAALFVGAATPEGATSANPGDVTLDATNGRLYLKRSGSGNTGWVQIDRCESGTYTPTATIVANLDSVTPGLFKYLRVGDTVFASGPVSYDPTTAATSQYGLSLPIASAFTAGNDLSGSGGSSATFVQGDAANDRADVQHFSGVTVATTVMVHFIYRVV